MKKQRGITLIALIITIIVMLILVGVTINVALNGGLFETTQLAADGTKKEAEKEQLLEAILAAVGTNGEVDFAKVVLPEGFTGSDGTYTGKSGTTYTVNKKTLEITEGTNGSGNIDNALLGVYYDIGMENAGTSLELKSNNEVTSTSEGKTYEGTYTYDENLKAGKIILQYETELELELSFNYITITDESGNEINSMLEFTQDFDGDYIITQYAKQKTRGLIPLDGYVYENGTTTIEFSNITSGSETYGRYTIKESGASTTDGERDYAYYNGKLILGNHEVTISADFSTITINGTVYTKKY